MTSRAGGMEVHQGLEPLIVFNIGPMFADKSELMLYYAGKYLERGVRVVVVKPSWDTRKGDPSILYSRSKLIVPPTDIPVVVADRGKEHEIPGMVEGYEVVMMDELQMLRPSVVVELRRMFWRGQRVICSLLDLTFEQRVFMTAAACMSMREADKYWKSGRCGTQGCKLAAHHTQKLFPDGSVVPVFSGEDVDDPGDAEKYAVHCWHDWLESTPGGYEELARSNCRFFDVDPATGWR